MLWCEGSVYVVRVGRGAGVVVRCGDLLTLRPHEGTREAALQGPAEKGSYVPLLCLLRVGLGDIGREWCGRRVFSVQSEEKA